MPDRCTSRPSPPPRLATAALGVAQAGTTGRETRETPVRVLGTYDDVSGRGLLMTILRPGHAFCVAKVKARGACARVNLAGGLIGSRVLVRGDRLSLPETYRTPNLGSLCLDYVPEYRFPKPGLRVTLTLVGYHDRAGKPVSARSVKAADCEPPRVWRHRS